VGAALIAVGGIGVTACFALAAAANAHYWHESWFIVAVIFFSFVTITGLWITLAGAFQAIPPRHWTSNDGYPASGRALRKRVTIGIGSTNTGFCVYITLDGPTLERALLKVYVPSRFGHFVRVDYRGDEITGGRQLREHHSVLPEADVAWQEELTIRGVKTQNRFFFTGTAAVDEIPVLIMLGGDELGQWVHTVVQVSPGRSG
jgi:hypothetical protein